LTAGLIVLLGGLLVNGCRISKLLGRPTEGGEAGGGGGGAGISVNPDQIVDSALVGDEAPHNTSLLVTNRGSWFATTLSPWISLTPSRGGARTTVQLSLNPKELSPGLHIGVVTLQENDSSGPTARVTVSLRMQQPVLGVKPSSFTFTARSSGAVFTDTVAVSNDGDGPLKWTATTEHAAGWLKLTNTEGTGTGKIAVRASNAGLAEYGTFRETIIVTAPGAKNSPQRISVTLRRSKHDNTTP
jgi:BACON domain-containing protein